MIYGLRIWMRGCVLTGLAIAATAISATAGPIDFTFVSSTTTPTITSSSGGGGSTTLTLAGKTGLGDATNIGTDISFGTISKSSTEPNLTPDTFNNPYVFNIAITDTASGLSHTITLNGQLTGSAGTTQSNLQNTFGSPLVQSVTIGSDVYTFDITPPNKGTFSNPGNPASNSGSFAGHISATGPGVNPNAAVPEPATLTSLGFGLIVGVGALYRRNKARLAS